MEEIQHARLEMALLKDEAMRGSSWIRNLYVDHSVPWGGALTDRTEAIDRLRSTNEFIGEVLKRPLDQADQVHLEHAKAIQQHLTIFSNPK